MTQPDDPESARRQLIARLIDDVRIARQAGHHVDDQTLIDSHPELMPELAGELEKLRRIEAARGAAESPTPPPADPANIPPSALFDDLTQPAPQVPGYSILREISRGGQAVVYLATQLSTSRKVALKLMRDGPFATERAHTRFRREVQALAALNHPNIVAIIDTGKTADGSRYLAMNYIAGENLSDFMLNRYKKDPTDPGKLLRTFLKICDAVDAAHRLGIIHRDLKPSNIRVDERGEPHILDFGLARTSLDTHAVSVTGEFLGSLPWSSPEQAQGDPEKIDARTDIYSLGVILYQILTAGRFPYQVVGNIRDVLHNILTADPTPPSKISPITQLGKSPSSLPHHILPAINETIEKIVLKALAKKPELRYQSASELARDVAKYLAGQRVSAPKKSPPPKSTPSPLLYIAAAILLIAITAALYLYLPHYFKPAPPPVASSDTLPSPLPESISHTIDLIRLIDLHKDVLAGNWVLKDGQLFSQTGKDVQIEIPYSPPPDYDFRLVFKITNSATGINIVGTTAKGQFVWGYGAYKKYTGIRDVNGFDVKNDKNPTAGLGSLNQNQQYTVLIKVRGTSIEAFLDDHLVSKIDAANYLIKPPDDFILRDKNSLGINAKEADITFSSLEVTEITGHGKLLREIK